MGDATGDTRGYGVEGAHKVRSSTALAAVSPRAIQRAIRRTKLASRQPQVPLPLSCDGPIAYMDN